MRRELFKVSCVAAALAAIVVAAVPATARPSGATATRALSPLEAGILERLNAIRAEHKLAPLRVNARLATAAQSHSLDMVTKGFFSHDSATVSFDRRIERVYSSASYRTWAAGENLLWSPTGLAPKAALDLWMASPGHRANILSPRWREIGVSAVTRTAAPGVYGGRDVTVVTTDFGVRK